MDYQDNLKYFLGGKDFEHLREPLEIKVDCVDSMKLYRPLSVATDVDFYRNDWAAIAFRCMNVLKDCFVPHINSFCSMGTGSGLETLCAIETYAPRHITITDLDMSTVKHAKWNITNNVKADSKLQIDLLVSEYFRSFRGDERFDLIYENLPNIPWKYHDNHQHKNVDQPVHASFSINDGESVPLIYRNHLLFSHYIFLSKAKPHLQKNGGVLCLVGARVPVELILKMFDDCGYIPHILLHDFKQQNEPFSNIPAYTEAERDESVRFAYYQYEAGVNAFTAEFGYQKVSGLPVMSPRFRSKLRELSFSAATANRLLQKNIKIGHEVVGIYAKLK